MIILALAQPRYGKGKRTIITKGVEMVVALDISNSMLADDLYPNRLEKAKRLIKRLAGELKGNKIALVLFYLLSPAAVLWACNKWKILNKIGPVLILYFLGIVVANLKPATLCGIESNGMILASGEEDVRVVFLDSETPLGERIR